MSQLRIVTANEGGSQEVPLADGTGNYSWGAQGGTGGVPGWQASTAYTEGTQVGFEGQLYVAATSFTSGSSFAGDGANWTSLGDLATSVVFTTSPDHVIPPQVRINDFEFDLCRPWSTGGQSGAGVSPGTDITTQLQNAITGLFANTIPGGTIFFSQPGTYNINGALQNYSVSVSPGPIAYTGSAQILFPGIANGIPSVPICIRGCGPGYFISGASTSQGVVLKSNAPSSGSVFGVVPGYASNATFGFSNISVYIDRVSLLINSTDPQCQGWNLQSAAKVKITDWAVLSNGSASVGLTGTGAGLVMPPTSNQGLSTVRDGVVRGMPVGYRLGEHGSYEGYNSAASCNIGIQAGGGVIPNKLGNFNCQGCLTQIDGGSGLFTTGGLIEGIIHFEGSGLNSGILFVSDPTNSLIGKITSHGTTYPNDGSVPSIGGLFLDVQTFQPIVATTTAQSNVAGRGVGWMATHPHDDFQRSTTNDPTGSIPGACSKTNHPWFPQGASTFSRTQGTTNGSVLSTRASGLSQALTPALRGGVSRVIVATVDPGSTNDIIIYGQEIIGGANTGNKITLTISNNQFTLSINASAKASLNSATVSGTPVNLGLVVLHDSTGLPYRIQGLVNGLKKGDYFLTGADQALFEPVASGTTPVIYDGFGFSSDILSSISEFQVFGLGPLPEYNPVAATVAIAEASGAGFTPDPTAGLWQTATVADSTAFPIGAPLPHVNAGQTLELVIEIFNNTAGVMGNVTWNAAYIFNGFTFTKPGAGLRSNARFRPNGTGNWICMGTSGATGY